jgi:hypothetical protein
VRTVSSNGIDHLKPAFQDRIHHGFQSSLIDALILATCDAPSIAEVGRQSVFESGGRWCRNRGDVATPSATAGGGSHYQAVKGESRQLVGH